jgi:tetratricopeptide (TPR) repeat protein
MSIKKWFGFRKKGRRNEAEDAATAADDADDEGNLSSILTAALELHESGRFNEAYPQYEKALKRFKKLLEADPESTQYQSDVATTQNNLGTLLGDMGRQEEAKERFERALELYEKLLKSNPKNTEFQSAVAGIQNNLGELLRRRGRREEAKGRYERALELVKGQKNPHDTGWTLSLLGRLELDRDAPDLETAQSFLESSTEKLNKDIRPHYPNAVNWLALCYYKRGEQTRREARKEKEKNRIKQLAKESSQFYTLAAANYSKAYELPYARMPTALLIDAYLADTFSRSVHVIAEADDRKAVTILTESIERINKAVELAKENEEQRKRVEGAWHDLVAKQCIRSVSLFKGEPEKQEQLLGDAIDHLI